MTSDEYYLNKRASLPDAGKREVLEGSLMPGMRVHVAGACGKAMASVTCILKEKGYRVTASDASCLPPMSEVLKKEGISCTLPAIENVEGADLLVVGNSLVPSAMEVETARAKEVPMISGVRVLDQILGEGKRTLVVTGTHGKTTASAMLVHVFKSADKSPAYMIGGSFQDSGESYSTGLSNSRHFIVEGDEYDCAFFDKAPKFLRYRATSAILTSIEHDHVDLYPNFDDYLQAFQFLVEELPSDGYLVVHDSAVKQLDLTNVKAKIHIYGKSLYTDISTSELGTNFGDFFIPMFGEYNVANATAVSILANLEGLTAEEIKRGLATYPGVHERQEIIGEKGSITIVRDFAHHPTAVAVTLEGFAIRYPGRRIVCVFEPRSNTSRRKAFESEYPKSFVRAGLSIIVSPLFRHNDVTSDFMDISVVRAGIESQGGKALVAHTPEEAFNLLREVVREGDVVVFMSNGDFGGIPAKFAK